MGTANYNFTYLVPENPINLVGDTTTFLDEIDSTIHGISVEVESDIEDINDSIENIISEISDVNLDIDTIKEKYVKSYDTVSSMKADSDISEGMVVCTHGFHRQNDDGGAWYKIVNDADANDMDIIELQNGLYAVLIIEKVATPEQFGAKGDGETDDTLCMQRCFSVCKDIALNAKTYIAKNLVPMVGASIDGRNCFIKAPSDAISGDIIIDVQRDNCCLRNISIIGSLDVGDTEWGIILLNVNSQYNDFYNMKFYDNAYLACRHENGSHNRFVNFEGYAVECLYIALNNRQMTNVSLNNFTSNALSPLSNRSYTNGETVVFYGTAVTAYVDVSNVRSVGKVVPTFRIGSEEVTSHIFVNFNVSNVSCNASARNVMRLRHVTASTFANINSDSCGRVADIRKCQMCSFDIRANGATYNVLACEDNDRCSFDLAIMQSGCSEGLINSTMNIQASNFYNIKSLQLVSNVNVSAGQYERINDLTGQTSVTGGSKWILTQA